MRERHRVVRSVLLLTGVLVVLLGAGALPTGRLLAIYVLLLAAIALTSLTRLVHETDDPLVYSHFESALRARAEKPGRPPELIRTERELTLGAASAGQFHARLLPLLRDTASARLLARQSVALDAQPDAARRLLGDEAWELVRPDRPAPADRNAPGPSLARIARAVDRIEAI